MLILWYLSVLFVRRDTRRRGLPRLARGAWIAAAVVLPLFGFALYLFMHILNSYLAPPPSAARTNEPQAGTHVAGHNHPVELRGLGDTEPLQALNVGARKNGQGHNGVAHAGEVVRGDTAPGWAVRPASATPRANPSAAPMPRMETRAHWELAVVQGPGQGQRFDLISFPARIGRGPEAQVALDGDTNVSRLHAELYEWEGALFIRDLGSMFGTHVNGAPVTEQALHPGDQIAVGETILMLRELS